MKLSIISPESAEPREICVVHALFAAGLERYHLRKPSWTAAELESWLGNFGPDERSRIVIHHHYELAVLWSLAGVHERDEEAACESLAAGTWGSRACHDLQTLKNALGRYDAVLVSPVFRSNSKPGYGPTGALPSVELHRLLTQREGAQKRTQVFALGGIDTTTTAKCRALGFDGIAVLGALWNSPDPVNAFLRLKKECDSEARLPPEPVMCLTQDGLSLDHTEQARRLCQAGARWIQLRMKEAAPERWLETACAVEQICRTHGAFFIVNDSVDIAVRCGADGVHLGKLDLDWAEARLQLGPHRILGGTVNNVDDVQRARTLGCLDYVGVGPWRFTSSKKNLSPVLGAEGVGALIELLGDLPAWVIGGVEPADLPTLRGIGARGAAVSSALFREGAVESNLTKFRDAWAQSAERKATLALFSQPGSADLTVTTL